MNLCIGLTGGIATGKSTFSRLLAHRLSAEAFCADACVHDLLAHDKNVAREITAQLTPQAYLPNGNPDRALLRNLVFSDAAKKTTLEKILHPRVRAAWKAGAAACRAAGKTFLAEIPLLFETGADSCFDAVVMVACSEEVRHRRLMARPGMDDATAKKMIASQWPMDTKVEKSHHVVWNDGSLDALAFQADALARFLFDVRPG